MTHGRSMGPAFLVAPRHRVNVSTCQRVNVQFIHKSDCCGPPPATKAARFSSGRSRSARTKQPDAHYGCTVAALGPGAAAALRRRTRGTSEEGDDQTKRLVLVHQRARRQRLNLCDVQGLDQVGEGPLGLVQAGDRHHRAAADRFGLRPGCSQLNCSGKGMTPGAR